MLIAQASPAVTGSFPITPEVCGELLLHPLDVATVLATVGGVTDPAVLAAALLHDTVEDTDTSFDEIEREFFRLKLREYDWNISRTAQALGIERTNLHKKLRALGIERDEVA